MYCFEIFVLLEIRRKEVLYKISESIQVSLSEISDIFVDLKYKFFIFE